MEDLELAGSTRVPAKSNGGAESSSLRNVVAIVFRRRKLIAIAFFGVVLGATLTAVLQPNRYDASMKILVKRDRAEPVVSPEANAAALPSPEVTEEELNSEVALLKSRDLLEQVVVTCGLQNRKHVTGLARIASILPLRSAADSRQKRADVAKSKPGPVQSAADEAQAAKKRVAIALAVRALDQDLKADVVKKTNLIGATYESSDPELAARVLATLGNLYLEKHIAVHRFRGAFDFFQQETEKYREELSEAEQRLVNFNRNSDVVAASAEKELTLQKLADFQVALSQTNAAIAETEERTRILKEEMQSIPTRMVTQVRDADDGLLESQLKANLLALEQKRVELLGKFEPTYRPVQEVDAQIAQARAALKEKLQVHEQTTDRDPTYEWTRSELAKANADLASLKARAQATGTAVERYEAAARQLGAKEVEQGDLTRAIKAAEENYLLSLRKEEEARISDALDRGRILNVAIAEPPSVPALPSNHRFVVVLFGMMFAIFVSAAAVLAAERADSTFRTPDEVGSVLNIPVLAAIPQHAIGERDPNSLNSLLLPLPAHE